MGETILIVDDSDVVRKLISFELKPAGYTVLEAPNGTEGIQTARLENPDLIILDVQMPDMDGYEVCKRIRSIPSIAKTPIIMCTGMSNLTNMQLGFEAGADDYIAKPFQPVELRMRIEAVLRRAALDTSLDQATGKLKQATTTIVVFSLRGGAGCSSLAVNMAVGLGFLWNLSPILLDLSIPTSSCDTMLNVKPKYNLGSLAQYEMNDIDADLVNAYLTPHDSGIKLMAGTLDPTEGELVTENLVSLTIDHLQHLSPYVVIDTAHQFTPQILTALDTADKIVMPITPDINSARIAKATLNVFDKLGYPREIIDIVVNWTFPRGGIDTRKIQGFLDHPISLVLPYNPDPWVQGINTGEPVIIREPSDSPLAGLLERFIWEVSSDKNRDNLPDSPTAMWNRINTKMMNRKADSQTKKNPPRRKR